MRALALRAVLLSTALTATPGVAAVRAQRSAASPVLEFPEPGLDDPALYRDYRTRLFRDARGNAFQVYLRLDEGRVVHLWANAANESIGFTARDTLGRPARPAWGSGGASPAERGAAHSVSYRLQFGTSPVVFGAFVLGSMRVERDFQYAARHLEPFGAEPFAPAEFVALVASVERLPPPERERHLSVLRARTLDDLRGRLVPAVTLERTAKSAVARVAQSSLDGAQRLVLELTTDRASATVALGRGTVVMRARTGAPLVVTVRVTTDADALTPLGRDAIFNAEFHAYARGVAAGADAVRARRFERRIRGVELLSYEEKLMAGLPNFATYFGRDMLVTALLMEPIWDDAMFERVLAIALRKLSPAGEVSHEEAVGGQAIRERTDEYSALVDEYLRLRPGAAADRALARALGVLGDLGAARESYHMVDDDFQLPVIAARYLANPRTPAARQRAFLLDTARSRTPEPALRLLLRNLAFVAERAGPYVDDPVATNLVGFAPLEPGGWRSGSWRDSGPGYANGRFAMDVTVVWVPEALGAMGRILARLTALGFDAEALEAAVPAVRATRLGMFVRDSTALSRAIRAWRGTARHFLVRLDRLEARRRITAKLGWLPPDERTFWDAAWRGRPGPADTLAFLALALDSTGGPIPVMHSDGATRLLLQDLDDAELARELQPFALPYPVGLFVPRLGPVAANDAYAPPAVWERWRTDLYHSPRVVWGREVNILLMALARRIDATAATRGVATALLEDVLRGTRAAVAASGLEHAELWSYGIVGERLLPQRYGTSSDVQLWNLTDLAVEFELARLGEP